jgi:hypothetical protein
MLLASSTPLQRGAWTLFNIIAVAGVGLAVLGVVGFFLWLGFSNLRSAIRLTDIRHQILWFGIPAFVTALGTVGAGVNLGVAVLISVAVGAIFWLSNMDWSGY